MKYAHSTVAQRITSVSIGVIFGLLVLEAALRCFGAFHTLPHQSAKKETGTVRILCVGDSFTAGTGAPKGMDYPSQLGRLLASRLGPAKYEVINGAVPGQNSTEIREHLQKNIDELAPDVVLLLCGTDNLWNHRGYYAYCRGRSLRSRLYDRVFRIRVFRLIVLLASNVREIRYQRSGELLRPAVQNHKGNGKGFELKDRGKYEEAVKVFLSAINADPRNTKNYFGLGYVYIGCRMYREALEAFERGVEAAPEDPENENIGPIADIAIQDQDPVVSKAARRYLGHLRDERKIGNTLLLDSLGLIEEGNGPINTKIQEWIESDISGIVELCREKKITIVLQGYPLGDSDGYLEMIAVRHSLPFVNHEPVFRALLEKEPYEKYFVPDSHCNARGYGVMARNILEVLVAQGFVDQK